MPGVRFPLVHGPFFAFGHKEPIRGRAQNIWAFGPSQPPEPFLLRCIYQYLQMHYLWDEHGAGTVANRRKDKPKSCPISNICRVINNRVGPKQKLLMKYKILSLNLDICYQPPTAFATWPLKEITHVGCHGNVVCAVSV